MQILHVNGRNLNLETSGSPEAPAVILLHHGLGSLRAWKAQSLALAAADWRAVAYDRWGYGGSDPRPALSLPYFEDDLADLLALLDVLDLQRVSLVGHSDGGTIALYFAAQHPERVARLVTVAAHIYVEPKMEPGIEGVRHLFENDARFRAALRAVHSEKYEAVFRNWFEGWHKQEMLAWDMRPWLRKIACPALVVQGVDDEHATPQHARDIAAAIPGAELWLVEGARHMLPQENAEAFNQRLLDFLAPDLTTESQRAQRRTK